MTPYIFQLILRAYLRDLHFAFWLVVAVAKTGHRGGRYGTDQNGRNYSDL